MKKICVVHHSRGLGGGSKSFIDIILMLKDKHDVLACIPNNSTKIKDELIKNSINYYEFDNEIPIFPNYSGGPNFFSFTFFIHIFKLSGLKTIAEEINSLNPDMVIYNTVVISLISKYLKKSIIQVSFIRETFRSTPLNFLYKYFFKNYINGACFIAEHERRVLEKYVENTEIIEDCLSNVPIQRNNQKVLKKEFGIQESDFVLLYMGGIDPIKGPDIVLKSMKLLYDKKTTLIFAGSNNLDSLSYSSIKKSTKNPFFRRLLKNIKVDYDYLIDSESIVNVGYQRDISKLMNVSDVIIFPSTKPHQPRPAIEAGNYKKTVIISDFKATREFFINDYNVLTFKPRNFKDLSRKIELLMSDRVKLNYLGENNFKMSNSKHKFELISIKLNNFVSSLFKARIDK